MKYEFFTFSKNFEWDDVTILMLIPFIIAAVAVYVLIAAANYRIFTKAGEKGWKGIIPFYNKYVLYNLTWSKAMGILFTLLEFFGIALFTAAFIITAAEGEFITSVAVIFCIAYIIILAAVIINAVNNYKLAKCFGYDIAFAIGLFFLPYIFTLILGFGKAEYNRN